MVFTKVPSWFRATLTRRKSAASATAKCDRSTTRTTQRSAPPDEPGYFLTRPEPPRPTRAGYTLRIGPLLVTGYVDRVFGRCFMDIAFRPGVFATDPAYDDPVYRSPPAILILPIPNPNHPGAMINEPSISAQLYANILFPVQGYVTGTVVSRHFQPAPGEPYINELWFCIGYDVTVRQPLGQYFGPDATPYTGEQRFYNSSYVMKLPEI